jgi:1,4-dihydroxy-2-naphthoate octaprenyltransferase
MKNNLQDRLKWLEIATGFLFIFLGMSSMIGGIIYLLISKFISCSPIQCISFSGLLIIAIVIYLMKK